MTPANRHRSTRSYRLVIAGFLLLAVRPVVAEPAPGLLERLSKTVATGRQKLSIVGIQQAEESSASEDHDVAEAEARAGFFDQDR